MVDVDDRPVSNDVNLSGASSGEPGSSRVSSGCHLASTVDANSRAYGVSSVVVLKGYEIL